MSAGTMPTVVVVDDDEPMCKALERSLRSHGFRVRTYTSAQRYLAERDAVDAQCVVADINMPGLDGVEMRRAERQQGHDVPTVFISGQVDVRTAVGAMKEGALDLLEKPVEESVLIDTVQKAIARSAAQRTAEHELEAMLDAFELLTPREAEVCALVASGRRNKEIAALIGTTEKTVKVHRARVMQKLALDSVADLVRVVDRVLGDGAPAVTAELPKGKRDRVVRVMTSTLAAADAPPVDRTVASRATRLTVQREAALAARKYF